MCVAQHLSKNNFANQQMFFFLFIYLLCDLLQKEVDKNINATHLFHIDLVIYCTNIDLLWLQSDN